MRSGGLGNDAFTSASSSSGFVITRDNFDAVWVIAGVDVAGITTTITGGRDPLPPSGRLALYASHVDVEFQFLFVTLRP